MARINPLGKIKDLTVETLKSPRTAAGRAVHQAKDAAAVGLTVADHVTRSAVATVGTLVQQRRSGHAGAPASGTRPEPATETRVDTSQPVNVVEELGLDPAPVDEPATPAGQERPEPETEIDAAADPASVEATPADVAEKVSAKAPARKAAAKKSAAKTTPSGKLPPRRSTETTAAKKTVGKGTDEG